MRISPSMIWKNVQRNEIVVELSRSDRLNEIVIIGEREKKILEKVDLSFTSSILFGFII